jgi:biotin carboxylase
VQPALHPYVYLVPDIIIHSIENELKRVSALKRIMILGASIGQIPAIEAAKALGLEVMVLDKNSNAAGMRLADIALTIDIIDTPAVLRTAIEYNINAIMTIQTDLPVPAVGYVADALNLPGVSYETAIICSNKILMRKKFAEAGIPQPQFQVIDNLEAVKIAASGIGFPCVVKAPSSSGSRGITKVSHNSGLQRAFYEGLKYSPNGQMLIEAFVSGIELGAQAFSVNGKCELVLLHNDTLSAPPYMIPVGHSFPSKLSPEIRKEVESLCKGAVDALGVDTGPTNIDLILDPVNGPKIIEVGARIGATCLPELIKIHCGIDWVKATVMTSLGEVADLKVGPLQPCAASIVESPADGYFYDVKMPGDVDSDKQIVGVEVSSSRGDRVSILRNGSNRIGKVISTGRSAEEAEISARNYKSKIEIVVKDDNPFEYNEKIL